MARFNRLRTGYAVGISALLTLSSTLCGQDTRLKEFMERPFDLRPEYGVGDTDFYHIRTVYLEMNDSGEVAHTRVLDGYYSREMVRIESGKRYDRFVWKYVRQGHRQGKGEMNEYTILPFTKDFRYELSVDDWQPSHFPVDLSLIPKTMEGWLFVVKLIDAHTFDVIANTDAYRGKLERVGDTALMPADGIPVVMDFPPLFTDTHFTNAPFYTTFYGVTLYGGEPCGILAFRADDNRLRMVVNVMDMKLPTDAVSYYWGDVLVSLETGRIASARIRERVDSITQAFIHVGAPMRQVVLREITMERLEPEEYEQVE